MKHCSFWSISLLVLGVIFSGLSASATQPTPTPKKPSLVDASNAAKKKRQDISKSGKESLVISTETVSRGAHQGHSVLPKTEDAHSVVSENETLKKMEFWRQKYREYGRLIEKITEQIDELNKDIPELWLDFYQIDDAEQRDAVISQELNASLMRRHDLKILLITEKKKFAGIQREARLDGALPGWFRGLR